MVKCTKIVWTESVFFLKAWSVSGFLSKFGSKSHPWFEISFLHERTIHFCPLRIRIKRNTNKGLKQTLKNQCTIKDTFKKNKKKNIFILAISCAVCIFFKLLYFQEILFYTYKVTVIKGSRLLGQTVRLILIQSNNNLILKV